jgi:hypothetical protein
MNNGQVGIFPSGSIIKVYTSANYGFTGFLKNNVSSITPVCFPDNMDYTVPNGKKLVITSGNDIKSWNGDTSAWNYYGAPTSGNAVIISSSKVIRSSNSSQGWTGYLIDE